MVELLRARERIKILTARIYNLNKGYGDYTLDDRIAAINSSRKALAIAERELRLEN